MKIDKVQAEALVRDIVVAAKEWKDASMAPTSTERGASLWKAVVALEKMSVTKAMTALFEAEKNEGEK